MSSKLLKKSIDLVCSDKLKTRKKTPSNSSGHVARGVIGPGKINKARNWRKGNLGKPKKARKGEQKDKVNEDFTQQNLEYLSNTSWKLEQSVYEVVLKHCTGKKGEAFKSRNPPSKFSSEENDSD